MKKKSYVAILFGAMLFATACNSGQESKEAVEESPVEESLFNTLITEGFEVEKVADGFLFTEGPVWSDAENALLFSDIPANIIYKVTEAGEVSEYINPSNNSNGLMYDAAGNLLICEHSGRAIRKYANGNFEVLINEYQGKKLNSPNDLTIAKNGDVFFTDPPYGFEKQDDSEDKELAFNGVYRFTKEGELILLDSTFIRPNGIALSPDEKYLYVAQSEKNELIKRFTLNEDKTLGEAKIILQGETSTLGTGTPDGLKVDVDGNLFATGPGGILVFSASGEHIGTIEIPEVPANLAFGGKDRSVLYITAHSGIYKIQTNTKGY